MESTNPHSFPDDSPGGILSDPGRQCFIFGISFFCSLIEVIDVLVVP